MEYQDNKGCRHLHEYHKSYAGGKKKRWDTSAKSLATSMQENDALMNNKHNNNPVSDNHSNDDNHQPSKQRENKV